MTEPASPQNPPAVPPRPKEPRTVSGFGIALGLTLFAASLTPSLVPRAALLQGVLGGAVFAMASRIPRCSTAGSTGVSA